MRRLCLVLALAACSGIASTAGEEAISLAMTPELPEAGDSVTLTLTNRSNAPAGYNLCTSSLARRTAGTWQEVESDRVCTMELRSLEPEGQAAFSLRLPDSLRAGEYRFQARVESPFEAGEADGTIEVATEPFEVP